MRVKYNFLSLSSSRATLLAIVITNSRLSSRIPQVLFNPNGSRSQPRLIHFSFGTSTFQGIAKTDKAIRRLCLFLGLGTATSSGSIVCGRRRNDSSAFQTRILYTKMLKQIVIGNFIAQISHKQTKATGGPIVNIVTVIL